MAGADVIAGHADSSEAVMTQQTVCGGYYHGAPVRKARVFKRCSACRRAISKGRYYISIALRVVPGNAGYRYRCYCGHCEASTPEGRASVAAVTRAREVA